jgi:hypothetical protein
MQQLQESNVALDKLPAKQDGDPKVAGYQSVRCARQRGFSKLNEINRLLNTRYQEHEDREADLDDEENSRFRSSAWSSNLKIYARSMR